MRNARDTQKKKISQLRYLHGETKIFVYTRCFLVVYKERNTRVRINIQRLIIIHHRWNYFSSLSP